MTKHPTTLSSAPPCNDGSADTSHQAIAARAYQNYLAGGRKDGQDVENWLKAEQELRAEKARASSGDAEAVKIKPAAGGGDFVSLQ